MYLPSALSTTFLRSKGARWASRMINAAFCIFREAVVLLLRGIPGRGGRLDQRMLILKQPPGPKSAEESLGLSVDAIRHERNALLQHPPRTEGGFRQYGEGDVGTLAFIRRVQNLGFRLSEIRGLLQLRGNRLQPCTSVGPLHACHKRFRFSLRTVQRIAQIICACLVRRH